MKVYLSGPMRGLPSGNRRAFADNAEMLRDYGHEVFSPGEHEVTEDFKISDALRTDLAWICNHAEVVLLLPGWEHSLGARAEEATARALGIPVMPIDIFTDTFFR